MKLSIPVLVIILGLFVCAGLFVLVLARCSLERGTFFVVVRCVLLAKWVLCLC